MDDAIAAAKEVAKQQAVQACHDAVANDWYWQGLRCQHGEPDVSYSCAEATVGLVLAVPLDPLHIPPEWASFCKITVTAESRAVMRMSCSDGSCPVAPSHDERPPQPGDDDNDAE